MEASFASQPAAVLFDIDGTLVDSMPIHFAAWTKAMNSAGLQFVSWEEFVSLGGTTAAELIDRLVQEQNANPDRQAILEVKMAAVQENLHQCRKIDIAVELAETALAKQIPVGLFTGGRRDTIEKSLATCGLTHLGEQALITPADLPKGKGKPMPDGLFLTCKLLAVEPKKCVYVGDSPLDQQAALAAGMTFIHVEELNKTHPIWDILATS